MSLNLGGPIVETGDDDDSLLQGLNSSTTTPQSGKIVGLITPLNFLMNFSFAAEWAAVLAVRDFNARSFPFPNISIPPHCNFQLSLDLHSVGSLMELARKYEDRILEATNASDRPMAVLGSVTSPGSSLLATLGAVAPNPTTATTNNGSDDEGILNISPLASSLDLDDRARYPYFARTIPSNAGDAEALCQYLQSIGVTRLAILYWLDNYGEFYYVAMSQFASQYNIQLWSYSFDDEINLAQAVKDLKATPLRYVLCVMRVGNWIPLFELLHQHEMLGDSSSSPLTSNSSNSTKKSTLHQSDKYVWLFSDSLAVELQLNYNNNFYNQSSFATIINRTALISILPPPQSLELQRQQFANVRHSHEFLKLLKKSRHSHTTHSNVSLPLVAPEPTLFALLTYDAVLALGHAACNINKTRFSSSQLHQYLNGLNFTGATGEVSLSPTTASRLPQQMTFLIQNVLVDDDHGTINLVNSIEVNLSDPQSGINVVKPLIFPSGSIDPPTDVTTPKFVLTEQVPLSVRAFVLALVAVSLAFSLYCAIWTVRRRKRPIVQANQPVFLVLLCCGTFLVAFSNVFSTWQYPRPQRTLDFGCSGTVWFLSIGFTTVFAALYCRTRRINFVYRNALKFRRVTVRAKDVAWPIVLLLAVNVVILSVWTAVHPPQFQAIVMDFDIYDRAIAIRYTCFADASAATLVCLVLLILADISAMVLLNVESYRARHLPSQFNESRFIAITNLVLLEALIIGTPILIVVRTQRAAFVVVKVVLCFILCMAVLVPTFVPKFSNHAKASERRVVRSLPDDVAELAALHSPCQSHGAKKERVDQSTAVR